MNLVKYNTLSPHNFQVITTPMFHCLQIFLEKHHLFKQSLYSQRLRSVLSQFPQHFISIGPSALPNTQIPSLLCHQCLPQEILQAINGLYTLPCFVPPFMVSSDFTPST